MAGGHDVIGRVVDLSARLRPTVSFMTSNPRVCLRTSLNILLPSRSSCGFLPRSAMALPNASSGSLRTWSSCSAGKPLCQLLDGCGRILQVLAVVLRQNFQFTAATVARCSPQNGPEILR
jgi:hypothetical protein